MNVGRLCLKSRPLDWDESSATILGDSLLTTAFQLPIQIQTLFHNYIWEAAPTCIPLHQSPWRCLESFIANTKVGLAVFRIEETSLNVLYSLKNAEGKPLLALEKDDSLIVITTKGILVQQRVFFQWKKAESADFMKVFDWRENENGTDFLVFAENGNLLLFTIQDNIIEQKELFCSSNIEKAIFCDVNILIKLFFEPTFRTWPKGDEFLAIEKAETVLDTFRYSNNIFMLFEGRLTVFEISNGNARLLYNLSLTRRVQHIVQIVDSFAVLASKEGSLIVEVGDRGCELFWRRCPLLIIQKSPLTLISFGINLAKLALGTRRRLELRSPSIADPGEFNSIYPSSIVFLRRLFISPQNVFCCTAAGQFFTLSIDCNDEIRLLSYSIKPTYDLDKALTVVESEAEDTKLIYLDYNKNVIVVDKTNVRTCLMEAETKDVYAVYCHGNSRLYIAHNRFVRWFDIRKGINFCEIPFENKLTSIDVCGDKLLVADNRLSVHIYRIEPEAEQPLRYIAGDYRGRNVTAAKFIGDSHVFAIIEHRSCIFIPLKPTEIHCVEIESSEFYTVRSPLPLNDSALCEEFKYTHTAALTSFCPLLENQIKGMFPEIEQKQLSGLCGLLFDCQGRSYMISTHCVTPEMIMRDPTILTQLKTQYPKLKSLDNKNLLLISL